jgi:N-acyl-D-amino-acid deacylase
VPALLGRLKDKVIRAEIRREMLNNDGTWQNPLDNEGFDGIYVALAKNDNSFNGMNISQIAQKLDMDPVDVIFKLLIDNDGFVGCIFQFMTDSDVEDIFKNPRVSVATDAVLFGDGIPTHPRGYATYPKILGKYVREKNLVSLEEAIKKMTSMPADIFGFSKKGRIAVGNDADLVVFNRNTIIDNADFLNPKAENEGYTLVAVGGKVVYHGGKLFECCAGKIMKRQDI